MNAQSLCFWSSIFCSYLALGALFIEAEWFVLIFGVAFFLLIGAAVVLEPDPVEEFCDAELRKSRNR